MKRSLLCAAALCLLAEPALAEGFAPRLAPLADHTGPEFWRADTPERTIQRLGGVGKGSRQPARWDHAKSLIAAGRTAEALGVLEVMLQDEPDLGLAASFRLAHGRVLVELGRGPDAIAVLDEARFGLSPEACAWRLRAFALAGANWQAIGQLRCAKPALVARSAADRTVFLVPAARAAVLLGQPKPALNWLQFAAPIAAVRIVTGEALLAAGQIEPARAAFSTARTIGNAAEAAEAELGLAQAQVLRTGSRSAEGRNRLEALAYRWRGGDVEKRALLSLFDLARRQPDEHRALRHAATLVRYHSLGPALPPLLGEAQRIMAAALAHDSRTPLEQAAGIYWEYRDLAPGGGEGDLLGFRLAARLQDQGLYGRAAGLLQHQLFARTRDIAQGPLSVRVAKLHILSGRSDAALNALRLSTQNQYPPAMRHERQRVEAVALHLLGRGREALAVLQDVPGSGALQAELLWKQQSWGALADLISRNLPPARGLSEPRQAMVLRQAIALAMLGREGALSHLRSRYASGFAGLPTATAFDLLTRPAGSIDADGLAVAMAAIPSVSPAGPVADLLDAAPPPRRGT